MARHIKETVTLTVRVSVEADVEEGLPEESYRLELPRALAAMIVDPKRPESIGHYGRITISGLPPGDMQLRNHRVEILETVIDVG